MARKLFERQAIRRRTGALANGVTMVVYTNAAGTVLADISATSGGSAIAGSTVTTADIAGFGPAALQFWGPPDGTDTLYIRVPSDTSLGVQEIEAEADARLDALEAGGGGAHPNLAAHDSLGLATDAELATTNAALDLVEAAYGAKIIDVENYRSAGTDTATLAAAITALPSTEAILRFQPGRTYTLTAEATIGSRENLLVEGRGATIKAAAATNWGDTSTIRHVLRFRDCVNVTVRDLQFHGDGAALTGTAGWWAMLAFDTIWGTDYRYNTRTAKNILVENCDFKNLRSYGFAARLVDGLTLRGCTFTQGYQDASNLAMQAAIARCDNIKVKDCSFDGGSNSSTTQGTIGNLLGVSPGTLSGDPYGMAIGWAAVMNYEGISSFTAVASGNYLTTVSYAGANETDTVAPDYAGNDFYFLCLDAGSGVNSWIIPSSSMKVASVDEGAETFVAQRNAGDEAGSPLDWAGQEVLYYSIKTSRFCRYVEVEGCTFQYSGQHAGVFLLGVKDFSVRGCRGTACADMVLDVEYGVRGEISGNTVDNPTGAWGIALLYLAHDVTISGNSIGQGGLVQYAGKTICGNITITGNTLRGSGISMTPLNTAHEQIIEGLEITGNTIRGGPSDDGPGRLSAVLITLGRWPSSDVGGYIREVHIADNTLSDCTQRAIQFCGIDGLDISGNRFSNTGYDAVYDDNGTNQSTRVVVDDNRLANIGYRSHASMGLYRTAASPTDPPRFGAVSWRNTQTSLNDAQAWYLPAGSAAHPLGMNHQRIDNLTLRDNAGTLQKSTDTTYPGDGTWASVP